MQVEWPCPNCNQKTLQIIKEVSSRMTHMIPENSAVKIGLTRNGFIYFQLHGPLFKNAMCEVVACTGKSGWEQGWDEERMILSTINGTDLSPFTHHCILRNT